MRFHASLRPLYSPQWMRTYLLAAKVQLTQFAQHARALSERIAAEALRIAQAAQRPYQYLRSSRTSKEELIEQIARRDQISSGLIAILSAVEPCLAMTVRGCRGANPQAFSLAPQVCLPLRYLCCLL